MSKTIAVIPARMGSKGLPQKNIKLLGNMPLVCWTIGAALEVDSIDEVWVTSESDVLFAEVLDWAENHNVDVQKLRFHKRAERYAQDHVQTDEVYTDWLRDYQLSRDEEEWPDVLVLLQPTSPFRGSEIIKEAIALYMARMPQATIFSCTLVDDGYYWLESEGGYAQPIAHEPQFRLGRQWDKKKRIYKENGAIYVTDAHTFSFYRSYRQKPFWPLVVSDFAALDIDTQEDWGKAVEWLNT